MSISASSSCVSVRSPRRFSGPLSSPPSFEIQEGAYSCYIARTESEIESALRLRFEVFNLELNEGLTSSFATGRDEDEFDVSCHHLIVVQRKEDRVVGTYRMQTLEMSAAAGFYSSVEFDLEPMRHEILPAAIELGRACTARDHRNMVALLMLWKGIVAYTRQMGKRYLFGCGSLTSQDYVEGGRVFDRIRREGYLHPGISIFPMAEYRCLSADLVHQGAGAIGSLTGPRISSSGAPGTYSSCAPEALSGKLDAATGELEVAPKPQRKAKIPRLLETYFRLGALACGPPAIDRQFGTIDFLVLFDLENLNGRGKGLFFGG